MVFSIIQKSQLEGANRLDAEYYQPEYLSLSSKLRQNKYFSKFGELISGGNYGVLPDSEDYMEKKDTHDYIYLVRGIDLRGTRVEQDDLIKVPKKYFIEKAAAKSGDLLFLVKGATIDTADSVSIMTKTDVPAIFNGSIFKPSFKNLILPEFVYVLMSTKYFTFQKRRFVSNIGIEYNSVDEIKNYDFLVPPINFQKNIKNKVDNLFILLDESKKYYQNAIEIFLSALDLISQSGTRSLCVAVNISDVINANRFDAEYFNSPCNKMLTKISESKTAKLCDLVDMTKGVEPGAEAYQDDGKLFIRVSSIFKDGIIDKDQKYLSDDLYNELKKDYQPQSGDILLTKDASIGVACVVREPVEGVVSSGVMRLKLKEKMNPEYLVLVLNSIVGQLQAERDAGGSIIAHWKPEQIKNLVVPILPISTQEKIVDLVVKSHEARKKAKKLLEEAKLKVEEMIEEEGEK